MPNGNIRGYQSDTYDKRGVSELQITYPKNESPTLTTENTIKIYLKIDTEMIERDFHRRCRVIYRACRRLYGIEKVQDECLRVFKVLFPIQYRAKNGEDVSFTEKDINRIEKIFVSWNAVTFSELDILLGTIVSEMRKERTREEIIEFCDDVMVVIMRIRKLTPREAGRLMDCDEKTLDVMLNCGVSKSALYKLFGNSIVQSCLFHIFRKLFIEREPDMVKGEHVQLSLF